MEGVDFVTDSVECTPKCISGGRQRRSLNDNEDSVGIIVTGRQTAPLEEANKLSTSDDILENVTRGMDSIIEAVASETGITLSGGLPQLIESPSSFPTISTQPSSVPTLLHSSLPTLVPSSSPSLKPSLYPSVQPSSDPTANPSAHPSSSPSMYLSAFDGDKCRFDIECMIGVCDTDVCISGVSDKGHRSALLTQNTNKLMDS